MHPTICVRKYTWVRLTAPFLVGYFVISGAFLEGVIARAKAEESHPGIGAESLYSEAVLAFNRKQTEESLKILEQLLKESPNHIEALELKALSLRSKGDDSKSLEVYQKLVQLKPAAERGPYHFEIGAILNRQKKPEAAKPHFERAIATKFNVAASSLYLGLNAFAANDLASAQGQFERAKSGGTGEIKVISSYYLGLIHFKNGYSTGGTDELMSARSQAEDLPESKTAQDIRAAAEKILKPFNSSQWYGNFSVLGQYDSNILQAPAQSAATNASTFKTTIAGGFGRVSSPMSKIQWIPSYRASVNKNFSSDAKGYEYVSNTASLLLNVDPVSTTTYGLRLEGNHLFQNDSDPASSAFAFNSFSLGGDVALFVKNQFDRRTQGTFEVSFKPVNYYDSPDLSGSTIAAKASAKRELGSRYWNPGLSLAFENNGAAGSDYRYRAYGGGLTDTMRLSGSDTVTLSADFLMSTYPLESQGRSDRNITVRAGWVRGLSRGMSLVGDASYTINSSSVADVYSYNRINSSLGVSWQL